MYFNGSGIDKNYGEAMKWYLLSANQNNADAQFNIGSMYYHGEGVQQDYEEALNWCLLSQKNGSNIAKFGIEAIYKVRKENLNKHYEN